MELEFREVDGRKVVLRGMSSGSPGIVSSKWMEGISMHGDVSCAMECLITIRKPSYNNQ
jgi:hypothetical protein